MSIRKKPPPHPAADFVAQMHQYIFNKRFNSGDKQIDRKYERFRSSEEDAQAQRIQDFFNAINELSQHFNTEENADNYSSSSSSSAAANALVAAFDKETLVRIIQGIQDATGQGRSKGAGIFSRSGFDRMRRHSEGDFDKTFGNWVETVLTASIEQVFSTAAQTTANAASPQYAKRTGDIRGLPKQIADDMMRSISKDVAKKTDEEFKKINEKLDKKRRQQVKALISSTQHVQVKPVDIKPDIVTFDLSAFFSDVNLGEYAQALSQCTFTLKAYSLNRKLSGFEQKQGGPAFTLGSTQATVSLFPYFLEYGSSKHYSVEDIKSVYYAALKKGLTNSNTQIANQLMQLQWLYELQGSGELAFAGEESDINHTIQQVIQENDGAKFLVAIDPSSGEVKVMPIRNLVIEMLRETGTAFDSFTKGASYSLAMAKVWGGTWRETDNGRQWLDRSKI